MNNVAWEVQKALTAIDELLELLHQILEALDQMGMDRPAINVNEAILNLEQLRKIVVEAQSSATMSPAVWKKIERVRAGLSLSRYDHFG